MTGSDSLNEFARQLNEARVTQHLSIRAVARVAGVPAATAQGWLNGRHLPAPALRGCFLGLVDMLGLTTELPDDLWGGAGRPGRGRRSTAA